MLKKLLIALALLGLLAFPAWAVNTVDTTKKGVITITPDGSTAYDSTSSYYVTSIEVYPSAANDITVLRHGAAGGPVIARFKSIDGGPQIKYFSGKVKYQLYIATADQTWGTAANVRIIINYDPGP